MLGAPGRGDIVFGKIVPRSHHNRTKHHSIHAQAASSFAYGRSHAMSDRCHSAARLTEADRGESTPPDKIDSEPLTQDVSNDVNVIRASVRQHASRCFPRCMSCWRCILSYVTEPANSASAILRFSSSGLAWLSAQHGADGGTVGRWLPIDQDIGLCPPLPSFGGRRYVSVRGSDLYNLFSDQLIFIHTFIFTRLLNEPPNQTNNVVH